PSPPPRGRRYCPRRPRRPRGEAVAVRPGRSRRQRELPKASRNPGKQGGNFPESGRAGSSTDLCIDGYEADPYKVSRGARTSYLPWMSERAPQKPGQEVSVQELEGRFPAGVVAAGQYRYFVRQVPPPEFVHDYAGQVDRERQVVPRVHEQ